jgi:hypothetical protein
MSFRKQKEIISFIPFPSSVSAHQAFLPISKVLRRPFYSSQHPLPAAHLLSAAQLPKSTRAPSFPSPAAVASQAVAHQDRPRPAPAQTRARPRSPSGPRRSPPRTRLRRSPHGRRRLSLACAPREPEAPRPIKGEHRGGARPIASRAPAPAPPEG